MADMAVYLTWKNQLHINNFKWINYTRLYHGKHGLVPNLNELTTGNYAYINIIAASKIRKTNINNDSKTLTFATFRQPLLFSCSAQRRKSSSWIKKGNITKKKKKNCCCRYCITNGNETCHSFAIPLSSWNHSNGFSFGKRFVVKLSMHLNCYNAANPIGSFNAQTHCMHACTYTYLYALAKSRHMHVRRVTQAQMCLSINT